LTVAYSGVLSTTRRIAGYPAMSGSYAYFTGDSTLIADISNPSAPVFVGKFDRTDVMSITGNYAYSIGQNWEMPLVYDISTPVAPKKAGALTEPTLTHANQVIAEGNYIYQAYYSFSGVGPASAKGIEVIRNFSMP
jgi:hypothetical protein